MGTLLGMIVGYLIGSFSTSYVAGRLIAGIDIRDHGSGNAGATNTLRVLGAKVGVPVFLIDILKGVVAVQIGGLVGGGSPYSVVLAGACAIIGHNWPIFFGFRGGRGIATTIGVLGAIAPLPTLVAGLIAIALIALTRYVSLGSLVFAGLMPFAFLATRQSATSILLALVLGVLAFWRHRANIRRLLAGRENKLGHRRSLD